MNIWVRLVHAMIHTSSKPNWLNLLSSSLSTRTHPLIATSSSLPNLFRRVSLPFIIIADVEKWDLVLIKISVRGRIETNMFASIFPFDSMQSLSISEDEEVRAEPVAGSLWIVFQYVCKSSGGAALGGTASLSRLESVSLLCGQKWRGHVVSVGRGMLICAADRSLAAINYLLRPRLFNQRQGYI